MRRLLLPVPAKRPDPRALLALQSTDVNRKRAVPINDTHMTLNQWMTWCDEVCSAAAELRDIASLAKNGARGCEMSLDSEPGRSGRRLGVSQHGADYYYPRMLKRFEALVKLRRQIRT
jgi:hypothetical protein